MLNVIAIDLQLYKIFKITRLHIVVMQKTGSFYDQKLQTSVLQGIHFTLCVCVCVRVCSLPFFHCMTFISSSWQGVARLSLLPQLIVVTFYFTVHGY